MEMSKKSSNKPRISSSPFSSSAEREELERALLSSSASATASSASRNDDAIPTVTAVPVVGDAFRQNYAPAMAVATMASLPPPPPGASAAASRGVTDRATARTAEKMSSAKSDWSMDGDDGVIVRPEPPSPPTFASNLPSAQHRADASRLRAANAMGAMSSAEEMAGVARAQRTAPKHERVGAVKMANAKAMRQSERRDEGLTVDEDLYHGNKETAAVGDEGEKQEDLYGNKKKGGEGGYEVHAYDVSEYDTFDYDVKEYKSIYD